MNETSGSPGNRSLEVTSGAVLVRGRDSQEAAVKLDFILEILEIPEKNKEETDEERNIDGVSTVY